MFSPGDRVRCKAGGPIMVVVHVIQPAQQMVVGLGGGNIVLGGNVPNQNITCTCCWWNQATSNFQQWSFCEDAIEDIDGK